MSEERIICAAIWYKRGQPLVHQPKNISEGIVIACMRHTAFEILVRLYPDYYDNKDTEQGFITTENRFVDRKEAAEIALKSGQVTEDVKYLFSEDLY